MVVDGCQVPGEILRSHGCEVQYHLITIVLQGTYIIQQGRITVSRGDQPAYQQVVDSFVVIVKIDTDTVIQKGQIRPYLQLFLPFRFYIGVRIGRLSFEGGAANESGCDV